MIVHITPDPSALLQELADAESLDEAQAVLSDAERRAVNPSLFAELRAAVMDRFAARAS